MGVTGLYSYMCEKGLDPVIQEKIKFLEEIEMWQAKNGGRPKIIIDMKEIIHVVVQNDNLGLVLGGRYATYMNRFRNFFESLKKANVQLIFFAMGNKLNYDLDIFIRNQRDEYKLLLNKIDRVDGRNGDVKSIPRYKSTNARAPLALHYNMLKLVREFGELRINYVRHNQEIAKYIKQHDGAILSVITNDNDFMVFDGDFQYWLTYDVNMEKLTGTRMCRYNLRIRLGLTSKQLQLLSALSGSMYLSKIRLKSFYRRIGHESMAGHYIAHLANYVKGVQLIAIDKNEFRFNLDAIACDVFGVDYSSEQWNAIEKGLAQYDLNFSTIDTTKHMTQAMKFAKRQNMCIYKLLTDEIHLITDIAFIDYRNYRSKNYAELIIPLLQKVYGILHAHEFQRPQERAICMKYTHDEPYKVQEEAIVYPPSSMKRPDLYDLIFQPENRQHDNIRWTLFQWLFDFEVDFVHSIKEIERKYFAVLVTIKYLLQQNEITIDEADAFLTTEFHTINLTRPTVTTNLPQKFNTHYIRIAHLYTKLYCFICHCIEVCGLSEWTDYLLFDGQFFHNTLGDFTSCAENKSKALERILPYRIY